MATGRESRVWRMLVPWSPPWMIVRSRRCPRGGIAVMVMGVIAVPGIRMPPAIHEAESEAPRARCTIPDAADPRIIRPSRPIHDDTAGYIRADVSGRVADVNNFRGRIVNSDVGYIMQRRTARNGINNRWHITRHAPGPERRRRDKPHAVVQRIKRICVDPDHRDWRIYRVLQCRPFNGLEHGITVIGNIQTRGATRHGSSLWHAIGDNGLTRLRRARHGSAHAFRRMIGRDHCKIPGQVSGWN